MQIFIIIIILISAHYSMAQEKWYTPVDIGQHVYINEVKQEEIDRFEESFEIDIDSRYKLLPDVKDIFESERDNWLDINREKYRENLKDNPNFRISQDHPLDLIVKEFSEDRVRIFVVFKFGSARWHHYYVLLKDYLVNRNEEIDLIFKLKHLYDIYSHSYKDIGYGSTIEEMERSLGKTYYEYTGQSPQLLNIYYENHNLELVFQDQIVKYVQHGKPGWMNSNMYEKHQD